MKVAAPGFSIRRSYHVTFSPDGDHLAVIGRDVVLWSVRERKPLRACRQPRNPSAVDFSPDGARFVVKSTHGELLVCETATAQPIARFAPEEQDEGANPLFASNDRIIDGSWSGEIRVRDATDLTPRVLWRDAHRMVTQVVRSAGRWAFVATATHRHPDFESDTGGDQVLLGEAPEGRPLRALGRRWRFLHAAALSPVADRVAVRYGTTEPAIEVVDAATGRVTAAGASAFGGTTHEIAWSPDGRVLVLVEAGGFSFRDAADLREIGWLPNEYAASVCFSPDGRLIACGGWQAGLVAPWPELLASVPHGRPPGAST